jgi:ribosome recycling factor
MFDIKPFSEKMSKSIEALHKELAGLRTGRASASLLDSIQVDAYGSLMPLSQLSTVNVVDARMLSVQVWDVTMSPMVEKAIRESDLGLNPAAEGAVIRIPIPQLNEERRKDMVKIAGKIAEQSRVSIRNTRREAMDLLKKLKNDSEISEDEFDRESKVVQSTTDDYIAKIDKAYNAKEKDIMTI